MGYQETGWDTKKLDMIPRNWIGYQETDVIPRNLIPKNATITKIFE